MPKRGYNKTAPFRIYRICHEKVLYQIHILLNNLIKIKKLTYGVDVVCSIEIVTGADNLASNQAFIRSKSASDIVDVVWIITI